MNELGIIFLVALILSAVGFIMYVYFFSVGYGFSIAGIGIALLLLFRRGLSVATVSMCVLFVIYGLRLGGYLLIRELKSTAYKNLLKNESKHNVKTGVKVCIWVSCAILYVCECAPVLFRMQSGKGNDAFAVIGIVLMAAGILMEMLADWQKTKAKKDNPGRFVSTGLYRMVRCPNYFGELLLWTGVFVSGLNVCHTPLQWLLCILGFLGINYVMFSGARRLELRQDKNYGADPAYQEYVRTTPIIIPFLPIYSVKKHKWLVA
ncbi:MAG: DUF1295 domain-containing protein [Lachnospiraceae bacterium]|nr:DUF1295 domain-containing protein [Lachnospiraceae bacterium]